MLFIFRYLKKRNRHILSTHSNFKQKPTYYINMDVKYLISNRIEQNDHIDLFNLISHMIIALLRLGYHITF